MPGGVRGGAVERWHVPPGRQPGQSRVRTAPEDPGPRRNAPPGSERARFLSALPPSRSEPSRLGSRRALPTRIVVLERGGEVDRAHAVNAGFVERTFYHVSQTARMPLSGDTRSSQLDGHRRLQDMRRRDRRPPGSRRHRVAARQVAAAHRLHQQL